MRTYTFPTVEELLQSGAHFGHSVNKWNPKMESYIYAAKNGVHIIDLDRTHKLLQEAGNYLFDVAAKGGQIIFVCTKKQVAQIAKDEATRCGALFMNERWMGGTITNYKIIKKSIDKLTSFKKKRDAGELAMYTKKERLLIDREITRLEKFFGGVVGLKGEPQAVVVVDAKRERTAINECRIFAVPVIALVDTNSDPADIAKVIPGNDDAAKSVGKILKVLADCVADGYQEFAKAKAVESAKQAEGAKLPQVTVSEAPRVTEQVAETVVAKANKPSVAKKSTKKVAQVKKPTKKVKEAK
jgi:small subunit ribosomal protein S2